MDTDVRATPQYCAVTDFYTALFAPGTEHIHAARDPQAFPRGKDVLFTGLSFLGTLEEGPTASLYRFHKDSGEVTKLCGEASLMRLSPDGTYCAYVQGPRVQLVTADDFEPVSNVGIDGVVEELRWSPDGSSIAFLVAGARADISGAQGGYAMRVPSAGPSWMPEVDNGVSDDVWRRIYIWRMEKNAPVALTEPPFNIWEFSWSGPDTLLVVASDHHGEGSWYSASLRWVSVADGSVKDYGHLVQDQVGLPRGAPSGRATAFVEAVCSDRGIICGTLFVSADDGVRKIDTRKVEVTDLNWRDDDCLLYAGLRGCETVIGEHRLSTGECIELFSSEIQTCGEWYPAALPDGDGSALVVMEGYSCPPTLARISAAGLESLLSFAAPGNPPRMGRMEPLRWTSADGLIIEGWLIIPESNAINLPLLIDIHGGPIWAHRNRWVARLRAAGPLVQAGYAVLLPNPRGSAGRGQDFARLVVGDMGGEDSGDLRSAVDHLAAIGLVDRKRVAVTGTSYGGFMSAWLITQDDSFAAAIPISPVSNWYSQHYTSQIPSFDEACLQGSPRAEGGQYFSRSPVFFASDVKTPTLTMVGARDKNTPPTQGLEFHHAVLEAGAVSALCTYPEDGHSLRGYPAYLDSATRTMIWLDRHMGDLPSG